MAVEYELKFQASEALQQAIAAKLPGPRQQIAMETTYYDTPTGRLSALRYTLRRRLENGVSVCTLKTPAGQARGEWEVGCEDIWTAIPLLIAAGAPAHLEELTREGVIPICGARFTRTAITVTLTDGVVEVALDIGFLLGGSRKLPLCEIEVELKEGTEALCDRFAQELAARYALTPEPESKFARALKLYRGD
ncbi:MAG: CYTH domain-containing protein [Oscillospiraceae bacterium]|nr:CYTH domain-containing protein [Oscillospiraceae bacterium]